MAHRVLIFWQRSVISVVAPQIVCILPTKWDATHKWRHVALPIASALLLFLHPSTSIHTDRCATVPIQVYKWPARIVCVCCVYSCVKRSYVHSCKDHTLTQTAWFPKPIHDMFGTHRIKVNALFGLSSTIAHHENVIVRCFYTMKLVGTLIDTHLGITAAQFTASGFRKLITELRAGEKDSKPLRFYRAVSLEVEIALTEENGISDFSNCIGSRSFFRSTCVLHFRQYVFDFSPLPFTMLFVKRYTV